MILTKGQEEGLKIAVKRYKNKEPYTIIAGYAGVGKSFLVSHIVEALNIDPSDVCYIAFTGKASLVLREKGCENSMTAHKLLYNSKELPDGTYEHTPKDYLDNNYKLIVVDEVSMLPIEMWQLLLSHRVHIIALGDPGQLPPIDGTNDVLHHPHVMLDEVVRQAQDSPIIRLSMDIRAGKWIEYGGPKACRIMSPEQASDQLLIGADQILCGKNVTRHQLNDKLRQIKYAENYTIGPKEGDKVICLKNSWQEVGSNDEPLVNGTIGHINNIKLSNRKNQLYKPKMTANFISDNDGLYEELHMDYKIFTEKEATVNKDNWKKFPKHNRPYEFDYAYAVTVHKYQGSEAEKVVVYDEWLGDREFHKKWLYTAVTRASKMLVVVK